MAQVSVVGLIANLRASRYLSHVFVTLIFACFIIQVGASFELFVPGIIRVAMIVEVAILALYFLVGIAAGYWRAVLAMTVFILYMLWQAYWFSSISNIPPNYNNILSFVTVLFPVVFYLSGLSLRRVLLIGMCVSIAYLVYYIGTANIVVSHSALEQTRGVLASDGVRDARVVLANQVAAFVLFFGFASLPRRAWIGIPCFALAAVAIYLSGSRVFQASTAVILMLGIVTSAVPLLHRGVAILLTTVFVGLSALSLFGCVVPNHNPYEFLFADNSGRARFYEFAAAYPFTSNYPLTGVGIPPSNDDMQSLVKSETPFFSSDLGISGVAFTFGLPFALGILVLATLTIASIPNPIARREPLIMALFWTTQSAIFSSFFAMTIFGGSATLFFGLTMFLLFDRNYFEPLFGQVVRRRRRLVAPQWTA